jgi:hypothetical protein
MTVAAATISTNVSAATTNAPSTATTNQPPQ